MAARQIANQVGAGVVPEVVIMRLPEYIRLLDSLLKESTEMISSQQLGGMLRVTPAQIRKDLSYFGRFGKQGRGYSVQNLQIELKEILGLNKRWNVALVGVGRLGTAILGYPGFAPEGFQMVAAFDANREMIGRTVGDLKVRSINDLDAAVPDLNIKIGIVAVPGQHAQGVVDRLTQCGVKGIINYAPTSLQAQEGVMIRNIDPVLSLQTLTYYL